MTILLLRMFWGIYTLGMLYFILKFIARVILERTIDTQAYTLFFWPLALFSRTGRLWVKRQFIK